MIINRVSPCSDIETQFKEVLTNRITIRLTSNNLAEITKQAKLEGYLNQSNWVPAAVLSNIHRDPVLTDNETQALRESNRQLAAIGRNLNQIAKILNIEFRESDKITKEMIQLLEDKLIQHKQKVNTLLTKNCQRWSINDEPFSD